MKTRGTDNFDFSDNLIGGREKPFIGYVSYFDKTDVDPRAMIKGSQNVIKTLRGTIASRFGLKRYDAVDTTAAGVISSYEWYSGSGGGTYKRLRVANSKLQLISSITGSPVWYDLKETSSGNNPADGGESFDFAPWYESFSNADRLLMVRGDNNILHWAGGITKIDLTTAANGITNLTVDGLSGAGAATGDVYEITGGGGSGAKIVVWGVTGNDITAFTIIAHGSGYSLSGGSTAMTKISGSGNNSYTCAITARGTIYLLTKEDTSETWRQAGFAGDTESSLYINQDRVAYIGSTEFTYLGDIDGTVMQTSTNLSGATTDIVISSVIVTAINNYFTEQDDLASYEADFLDVLNNQVFVCSYSSRQVLLSADANVATASSLKYGFLNFTNASDYIPGDPDRILLDSPPTAIITKDSKAYISAGNSDWYLIELNYIPNISFSYDGTNDRFVVTKVDKKVIGTGSACLAHEFIDISGNDIYFIDQNNQLRTASVLANLNDTRWPILSLPIYTELKNLDLTGGHLRKIENTIFITAPNEGIYLMYETRENVNEKGELISERFWQPPQVSAISRFTTLDGVIYGYSSVNPQLYQIFDTGQWFDDDPSQEQVAYTSIMRMAYRSHGKREGLLYFDKIYYEGYISAEELKGYVFVDYQGSTAIKELDIHTTLDPVTTFSTTPPSIGDSALGLNPMGTGVIEDTNEQEALPKFRAVVDVDTLDIDCFEYALQVYTTQTDSRWEILYLGTNAVLTNEVPTFIRK